MYRVIWTGMLTALAMMTSATANDEAEWIPLFDGQTLSGWTASENKESCKVEDGKIVLSGPRSHLYYTGDVAGANFTNFEFKAEVLTHPQANSGIYFHTTFQETGWPKTGYEAQVNCTHSDIRKTGGLYGVDDVLDDSPVEDGEWFTYHITVSDKHIVLRVNDKITTDYTEPEDLDRPDRQLSSGTFALQAHDPKSRTEYRNIMVKLLPATDPQ